MKRLELEVEPTPDAPRRVRRALSGWLSDVECPDTAAYDAHLIVSELVTNAVIHTRSGARVVVAYDDGRLRIEVYDEDPAPPRLRDRPGPDGGFGLRIIAAAADGWGWRPTASGKLVWTEVLC